MKNRRARNGSTQEGRDVKVRHEVTMKEKIYIWGRGNADNE